MIFSGLDNSSQKSGAVVTLLFLFAGVIFFIAPVPARAEEDIILSPILEAGDSTNVFLAERIEKTALWLDTFLGGEEAFDANQVNTGSLIQAGTKTIVSQFSGFKSESSVRARIVLPRTQERLNLVLQSDAEETEESKDTALAGDLIPVEKVTGFGAALEGIIVDTEQWRAALRGGVQTKIPPDAFMRFGLRLRWHTSAGRITLDEKAYWYAVAGLANRVRFYWDIPGEDGLFFRPSAGTNWNEDEPGYIWDCGLGFYQLISDVDVLAYDVRLSGKGSDSPYSTAVTVKTELRHKLYKNWVFLGLGPGVAWKKDLDFNPELFFAVRFDMIFSKDLTDAGKITDAEEELIPLSPEGIENAPSPDPY